MVKENQIQIVLTVLPSKVSIKVKISIGHSEVCIGGFDAADFKNWETYCKSARRGF